MTQLTPERIMHVGMGYWPSRTLQAAVKLGVFTVLGGTRKTGAELCEALGLAPRANPDFFDALVAMKFLERDGDGPGGRYYNGEEAAVFLDRHSPGYMGGVLEMMHDRLYPFWCDLVEALKTGRPQNEIKHTGRPMFDELYADPARLQQFLSAMAGVGRGNFMMLAEKFDFSPYGTLCDVGGAEGVLAMEVARANPHLKCTSADLDVVEPIAKKRIAEAGLSDRVDTAVVDFFAAPLPKADVITMGMILHDWDLPTKKMLIGKVYDALPPGGAFIVVEQLIDDARRENVTGLMMSLNMLIEFGDSFDYTGADFGEWTREAGFARYETMKLAGPSSAAIAYK